MVENQRKSSGFGRSVPASGLPWTLPSGFPASERILRLPGQRAIQGSQQFVEHQKEVYWKIIPLISSHLTLIEFNRFVRLYIIVHSCSIDYPTLLMDLQWPMGVC